MSHDVAHLFVITGGPGSGKSTLIDALQRLGYTRSIEAGRAIIRQQMAIGGSALPWLDRAAFAELMLSWEMRSYAMLKEERGPTFFDRGIPDVIGYLELIGLPVLPPMLRAAELHRYNSRVFIAPPWPEIFSNDQERRQDFDEAIRTYEAVRRVYSRLGYDLIELPRATIEARIRFVLDEAGIPRLD